MIVVHSKFICSYTGGGLIGLAFGVAMRYVLRWMRHLGAGLEQQVAMTFAVGYLSYYTANAPAGVSGLCRGFRVCLGLSGFDRCRRVPVLLRCQRAHRGLRLAVFGNNSQCKGFRFSWVLRISELRENCDLKSSCTAGAYLPAVPHGVAGMSLLPRRRDQRGYVWAVQRGHQ